MIYDVLEVTKTLLIFPDKQSMTINWTKTIIESINIVKNILTNKYLHCFGLYLRALPYMKNKVNIFDSARYAFPTS